MRYIKKGVPRSDGNGWKLSKFHEMLHLPDNMVSFGAIPNFMAESPEMFLKFTVKKAGKRAQKRKDGTTFEQQSARRLFNIMLTDDLYKAMNEEPCGPEKNDNTDWLNSDTPVSSNVNPSEIEDDEDSDDDSIEEAVEKESIFESVANGTKFTLSTQTNWEHEG